MKTYEFWTNDWQADGKYFVAYVSASSTKMVNHKDVESANVCINSTPRRVLGAWREDDGRLAVKVVM